MSLLTVLSVAAFENGRRVAFGGLLEVASTLKAGLGDRRQSSALVFSDVTGRVIDIDFSGSPEEVLARLHERYATKPPITEVAPAHSGPGRPKLGVVAREVTLLPRHWDWLNSQPGGASAALRRLVDGARRESEGVDRQRQSREAAYAFMSAIAGNEPGFEEASRALFSGNQSGFMASTQLWQSDVRDHALQLAAPSWPATGLDSGAT